MWEIYLYNFVCVSWGSGLTTVSSASHLDAGEPAGELPDFRSVQLVK